MTLTTEQMHNKVYHLGENEPQVLKGGGVRRLLARIGNISLYVCDAMPGMTINVAANPDEVVLFFLDGCVNFDDRRVVRADEAIFQCPNVPLSGRFVGTEGIRFLSIHVTPLPGAKPVSPSLMESTIRLDGIQPVRRKGTGSYARDIVETESTSVTVVEQRPVVEVNDPGHPENEVVYVMRGKLEYLNGPGRVVRPGECVTNIPGLPHPMRYTGTEPARIMEILSPPYGKPKPAVPAAARRRASRG